MRIVSLVPSQTELLFYLGLDEEVVGITKFCIHPDAQFRSKTRVGGTKTVNLDKVRALAPTLIIANKEENQQEQIEALQKEFKVWISDIKTLEDSLEMIEQVGDLVDKVANAKALVKELQSRFAKLSKQIGAHKRKAAYFIWREPWMICARNTFIDDMLTRAGYINVFEDKERYPTIDLTDLASKAPEVILLSSEPYPFKEKHIAELQAVCPNAKIHLVDGELFSWYGNRLLKSPAYFSALKSSIQTPSNPR